MVVGAAALYLASPLSDRTATKQTVAGMPSGAPSEPLDVAAPDDLTSAVSGLARPEALPPVDLGPTTGFEPDVEPEAAEPEAAEPVAAEPVPAQVEPVPDAYPVPELAAGSAAEAVAEPKDRARQVDDVPVTTSGGWVCDGAITIDDGRAREWSLGRVSFRVRPGFERVVLHLEQAGAGFAQPVSVTAEAVPTTGVRSLLRGVSTPSSGRTTIGLRLSDGFGGNLALRGYRPGGLATIKEFSVYPSGRDGKNVLISAESDGCFRLGVPAWNDASNSLRRAEIHIDVKP